MKWPLIASLLSLLTSPAFGEMDVRGNLGLEITGFLDDPAVPVQHGSTASFHIAPEFSWRLNDGDDQIYFSPFLREDGGDDERSHADIRELLWLHLANGWELRSGIGKVFWGVTESVHLVDIVNQTDTVEDINQEEKLGQPMVWLSLPRDFGIVDLFVLPGFRERTYPGIEGRFRTIPHVDDSAATYESDDEDEHIDYAARWSHYIGSVDFGLSWFNGTSRDPLFIPENRNGTVVLTPFYPQIEQFALDLQSVLDAWLLKLEIYRRTSDSFEDYTAMVTGFEYTFGGVFESRYDLGVIMEYLYDSREDETAGPFQDDLFVGVRLAFNDAASSELLAGIISDRQNHSRLFNLEGSRRISDNVKLSVEARAFSNIAEEDPLFSQRQDDSVRLILEYFF